MTATTVKKVIKELQRRLDAAASEKSRHWWENYLRGVIAFRGVGIPQIREILASWRYDTGVEDLPLDEQLEIAFALFEVPITEDKLAGILLLQNYLRTQFHWQDLLPRYAKLYDRNLIYDWNTCDWFCVRVLGPTLADNGLSFARALSGWRSKKHLWQARSAAVPFISVAGHSAFYPLIKTTCTTLIKRPERFAKTAVGWVLRDVSIHDSGFVLQFMQANIEHFSVESARNAMKYMDSKTSGPLVIKIKKARA